MITLFPSAAMDGEENVVSGPATVSGFQVLVPYSFQKKYSPSHAFHAAMTEFPAATAIAGVPTVSARAAGVPGPAAARAAMLRVAAPATASSRILGLAVVAREPAPCWAADAAWAVADTLHVAARMLRSPELRRAADAYDRAARAPHGRIPRPSGTGEQLRYLRARPRRPRPAFQPLSGPTLILSLATLADAVAELRAAQHHAARPPRPAAPPRTSTP